MSDTVALAVIAAIPGTIAASFAGYAAFMASKTHKVVNGGMLIQLKLHAKTSKALLAIKETPENLAIAQLAEKLLVEHQEKLA